MSKKVVAIQGSYRKGRVSDLAVDAVLRGAESAGAVTEKIYLIDQHIEFCDNCRACCQQPGTKRGKCSHKDDMDGILDKLEQADAMVFCSPMNAFTVTAVMKRFIERLTVYAYWPWSKAKAPGFRNKKTSNKKAIVISSSAMPAIIGRLFARNTLFLLKSLPAIFGIKRTQTLYFGMVAQTPDSTLTDKQLRKCFEAGRQLVR